MPSPSTPIRINGIKLSQVLVLIDFKGRAGDSIPRLFSRLRQNRINLAFITTHSFGEQFRVSFCADTKDVVVLKNSLETENGLGGSVSVTPAVGLVSLFPHRSDFQLPGIVLSALASESIPIYGFSTSLSMLTMVTDFLCQDSVVAALRKHVYLPPGYIPIRPEFRVTQTAVEKGRS
jgi:aspartokinase